MNSSYDYSHRTGIYPVSWKEFHGICKALALSASRFQPEIILAVGRGGFYPGTLIAHLLQVEIYPIRISRRVNDVVMYRKPQWLVEPPALIAGKRVLIVDEISSSGETITMVKDKAASLGAKKIKSAVMYAHTWGTAVPDYIGLISDALFLNPWDREILKEGIFQFHPEYVAALANQGVKPSQSFIIEAPSIALAKEDHSE